jgi:hypothetical protein
VRVQGYVHFLSREEVGSPGTIGVDLIENDDVNKIRVRVPTNDQYHLAVSAHDAGRPIEARGNLQREGNLWWLYDATLSNFERPDADDQETRSASGGLSTTINDTESARADSHAVVTWTSAALIANLRDQTVQSAPYRV